MNKVTIAIIGLGARGTLAYAPYAKQFGNEVEIVAGVDPNPIRRNIFQQEFGLTTEQLFESWEDFVQLPKLCDAVVICTQDRMHFEPTMAMLRNGYHVLLEKPISPNPAEVLQISQAAKQYNRMLSICHVSRYTPFWQSLKQVIADGRIGEVVSMQLNENVGYLHYAHSFVRGNWRNSDLSSPMILQKSCHDMDLIRWIVDSECTHLSSFGSLTYFTEAHAPAGSTDRCMDGCAVVHSCPFSAPRFYLQDLERNGFARVIADPPTLENRLDAVQNGPYGRCVYRSDNNVVDHQTVNMQFANGATAIFSMCAFTRDITRITQIMGTQGELRGNLEEGTFNIFDFATRQTTEFKVDVSSYGHGGGDEGIMRQFIADVRDNRTDNLTSAEQSVDSHMMAFAAESSRLLNGQVVDMRDFVDGIINPIHSNHRGNR